MSRPLLQLSEGDPVIDPLIDPLQNPVILLRIAHGIEAEAKGVETGTATMMTRGQEVEGELVQDHHPQDKVTASGSQQTEVRGGGNYRGHRHLPARGPHGIGLHVTATDTYLHLEMTVIIVIVTVIAIQIEEVAMTKVEAMGLVAIRRQILYSLKC